MVNKRVPSERSLIPIVGGAMAAVAAGSLVLFSVFAQRTALSPGGGGVVVPHVAQPPELKVINVPRPPERAPVSGRSADGSASDPKPSGEIAQLAPRPAEPRTARPNEPILVASVKVDVPIKGENDRPVLSRPALRFARNLDPPGPDDPDEGPGDEDPGDDSEDDSGDPDGTEPTEGTKPTATGETQPTDDPEPNDDADTFSGAIDLEVADDAVAVPEEGPESAS